MHEASLKGRIRSGHKGNRWLLLPTDVAAGADVGSEVDVRLRAA